MLEEISNKQSRNHFRQSKFEKVRSYLIWSIVRKAHTWVYRGQECKKASFVNLYFFVSSNKMKILLAQSPSNNCIEYIQCKKTY